MKVKGRKNSERGLYCSVWLVSSVTDDRGLDEVPLKVLQVLQQCGNMQFDTCGCFLNHLPSPPGNNFSMGGFVTSFWIYTDELSLNEFQGFGGLVLILEVENVEHCK